MSLLDKFKGIKVYSKKHPIPFTIIIFAIIIIPFFLVNSYYSYGTIDKVDVQGSNVKIYVDQHRSNIGIDDVYLQLNVTQFNKTNINYSSSIFVEEVENQKVVNIKYVGFIVNEVYYIEIDYHNTFRDGLEMVWGEKIIELG